MKQPKIFIIDLGSQYTLLIRRTIGELGYRSVVIPAKKAENWLKINDPEAIVLSGGSASVYEKNAPIVPRAVFEKDVSILGICYGMQYMAHHLGGEVTPHQGNKEYGKAKVYVDTNDLLFSGITEENTVWASHGDSVTKMPLGFQQIAYSKDTSAIQAMCNTKKKMWGLQFHPEVTHSVRGKEIIANFLQNIADCKKDWEPKDAIEEIQEEIKKITVGKKCIIGFSGGVDSTTLSAIASPVFGRNLLAVLIDTGALRHEEIREIRDNAIAANVTLKVVRAAKRFQKALGNATDAEIKRKRFKKMYGRILEEEAKKFGADFIIQGSLATDIIESGKVGEAVLIKSHHNVGLNLNVKELHPFRNIFKYEVRDLARAIGLPKSIVERQPFPGPGLFIRVRGAAPKPDKLKILKWADHEITMILKKHKIYEKISQLVVGLNCTRAVGIKGDARVYGYVAEVRGVKTSDFMTAEGFHFSEEVEDEICDAVTKHPKIVHVAFYPTNKPPATTEFE
ncbi:MAG: glutamine-hydrolyzing GMP synthase [bacterium]|nr:glutamine-hydrolyzing GMP synthase [bacterium]